MTQIQSDTENGYVVIGLIDSVYLCLIWKQKQKRKMYTKCLICIAVENKMLLLLSTCE